MIFKEKFLDFIHTFDLKDEKEFVKIITNKPKNQRIFNERFFEGKNFHKIAKIVDLSASQCSFDFKYVCDCIWKHMYLHEKIRNFHKTGNYDDILLHELPISRRLSNVLKDFEYLYQVVDRLTKQQLFDRQHCGKNCIREILSVLNKFDLKFIDHDIKLL